MGDPDRDLALVELILAKLSEAGDGLAFLLLNQIGFESVHDNTSCDV